MSSERDEIRRDLPADLDEAEAHRLIDLGLDLIARKPTPAPGFRGNLRRRLSGATGATGGARQLSARQLGYACLASGLLLLSVSAIGLVGGGPFAA